MDQRRTDTLAELDGVGTVWCGGNKLLENAPYFLRVSQDVIITRTHSGSGEIPGMKSIDGVLRASDSELFAIALGPCQDLELELEDGTRWLCFLTSNGRLVNRGGFKS